MAGEDRLVLFNVFRLLFHWSRYFNHGVEDNHCMYDYIKEDPDAVKYGLGVLGKDVEHAFKKEHKVDIPLTSGVDIPAGEQTTHGSIDHDLQHLTRDA